MDQTPALARSPSRPDRITSMRRIALSLLVAAAMCGAAGCSNSSDEKTDASSADRQQSGKNATPAMQGAGEKQPGDRDPTPETGTGGDQQTSQPDQPKPK